MVGKLVRLELLNFKSYKGHHILPFGDSYFTSIIGPNGSGKSNSMDAISFVLGISSSHLRSTQLRDLVYRGRVLKHSKINADGTAESLDNDHVNGQNGVNGAYSDDEGHTASQRNDPQTAWVMAVYEDEVGHTHEWKRSIKASGQSEYRINGRVVNQKQYNEALEQENILIKARNFLVFQGDVEAIASQSPRDLTRLIEQISGSGELKDEYERLKTESEKSAEDYAYRLTNRRNLNTEIKQYQEQQKEAENFERKTNERDNAIVKHILWKLYHLQQQIEESGAEIHKHQAMLKEHKRNIESFENTYDETKREYARVNRESQKFDRSIKQKEREIAERSSDLVPIDEKLVQSASNVSKGQERLNSVRKERDIQAEGVDHLKKSLATVEKAQKRWEDEWKQTAQKHGKALSDADLQEYDRLRGEVTKTTTTVQIKLDNVSRSLKTSEESAGSLKSRLDANNAQLEHVQENLSGLTERRNDMNAQLKQTQKDVDVKKKELNQLSSERLRRDQMRTELEEKLQDVLQRLGDAETGKRESDKEVRMRETVAAMKRIYPGVRGRVHELCRPKQKKYETAVGVVLGRHWDSIVVDTESTARDCLQYLKDNRSGQATFIPLDTIQVKQINPSLKNIHRGTRLAIDIIDYDSTYERAMAFACGTAVVCDDLQIAKHVCFTKGVDSTAVTLDGTKISKGGLMTGGRGTHDKPRRWDDAEVENLHKLKNKFLGEIEQLNASKSHRRGQEEEALQGELAGLQQRLEFLRAEVKATERNLQDKKKELEYVKQHVKEISPRYQEQAKSVESLRKQHKTLQDSVGQIEDKVFGSFCRKHGYKDIREYEAQQGSLQQEALSKKLEFSTQKSRLQNQLSFETQRLSTTNDRIKRLETQLQQDNGLIRGMTAEKESIESEIDGLREKLETLKESKESADEKATEAGEKVAEARRTLQKRSKVVDDTLKQIAEIETSIQRNNANRFTILRKCRIEEIKIPLTEESEPLSAIPLGDVSADADAMDIDVDEGSGQVEEIQDYGIDVDFDSLEENLQENGSAETEESLKDVISSLNSELDKMAPNMRATDRLQDVAVRLESTEKELEMARRAAKRSKDTFEQVKEERLDLFNKAYEHITEQIERVYVDLTKNSATPMGGKAYLDTEEPDEPYLAGIKYHAMPPLKRFRDMEHLSGGEKTMAALALLFAIHSFQPSPFFVLDEVDAALDNANVSKLVNYIRENARPGMQFIVISLKPTFFEGSQTLIGVMRDQSANSSKTLTLDLRQYRPA